MFIKYMTIEVGFSVRSEDTNDVKELEDLCVCRGLPDISVKKPLDEAVRFRNLIEVSNEEWKIAKKLVKKFPKKKRFKCGSYVLNGKKEKLQHTFLFIKKELFCIEQEKSLGAGAYGEVKRCQMENGDCFAVKIGEYNKDLLKNEVRALTGLGLFKGRVVLKRKKSKKKQSYIVQSLMGGVSLKLVLSRDKKYKWLAKKIGAPLANLVYPAKPSDIRQKSKSVRTVIAYRATEKLQNIHEKNFLHLDIKPSNVMYKWSGKVLELEFVDFGFALKLKKGKSSIKGVPRVNLKYMPPDLLRVAACGQGSTYCYTKSTDIHELGMMFFCDLDMELPIVRKMVSRYDDKGNLNCKPKVAVVKQSLKRHLIEHHPAAALQQGIASSEEVEEIKRRLLNNIQHLQRLYKKAESESLPAKVVHFFHRNGSRTQQIGNTIIGINSFVEDKNLSESQRWNAISDVLGQLILDIGTTSVQSRLKTLAQDFRNTAKLLAKEYASRTEAVDFQM